MCLCVVHACMHACVCVCVYLCMCVPVDVVAFMHV